MLWQEDVEVVKAIKDYEAQGAHELSFKVLHAP